MKIPFKNVMLTDILEQYPEVNPQTSSESELEVILYKLGIDIEFGFEQLTGLFRNPKDNLKIEQQTYWTGLSRTDNLWIKTGNLSEEDKEYARSSISRSMSNYGGG